MSHSASATHSGSTITASRDTTYLTRLSRDDPAFRPCVTKFLALADKELDRCGRALWIEECPLALGEKQVIRLRPIVLDIPTFTPTDESATVWPRTSFVGIQLEVTLPAARGMSPYTNEAIGFDPSLSLTRLREDPETREVTELDRTLQATRVTSPTDEFERAPPSTDESARTIKLGHMEGSVLPYLGYRERKGLIKSKISAELIIGAKARILIRETSQNTSDTEMRMR